MVSATKSVGFALILVSLPGEFIFERGIGYPFTFMHEFSDGGFEYAWDGLNPQAGTFTPVHLDDYRERVTYDPNGNILKYNRHGDAAKSLLFSNLGNTKYGDYRTLKKHQ
jgi:hypothetical protein